MLSQAQIAQAWGPACQGKKATINLNGTGKVTVRSSLIDATKALNACLVSWNYKTRYADTGAFNCRKKTSGNGWSNHSYGTAIDINWLRNPYSSRLITDMPSGMVEAICRIRTNNGARVWNWGGYWDGSKDAMHYEIICRPSDIATGINWNTVSGKVTGNVSQPPIEKIKEPVRPPVEEKEEDMTKLIRKNSPGPNYGSVYAVNGFERRAVSFNDYTTWQFLCGAPAQCDDALWDYFMRNTTDVTNLAGDLVTIQYIRNVVDKL